MAKQGVKRIDRTHTQPHDEVSPVQELQGKAKCGKTSANLVAEGIKPPSQKVYHTVSSDEKPISKAYPTIDNDLARDNLENDLTAADLQDL